MKRVRPSRRMDDGARRWMLKHIKNNYWRVSHLYEFEDLIQDGYMHYQRVLNKYPHVKDPPHLMRLFQRTFTGHIHNLAKYRTRERNALATQPEPQELGPDPSSMLLLVAHAPPPLRSLLTALQSPSAPQHLRAPYQRSGHHRETLNERLCQLAGIDPSSIDLPRLLWTHFKSRV